MRIPQAVMGLTLLAAGNCTPETICNILMIRRGEKGVGVSNSLGSCSLNIFLSLGVPWLIRNLLQWNSYNTNPTVQLDSNGIESTVLLLFLSVFLLYIIMSLSGYRLSKTVGLSLFISYLILIILSVLFEMNLIQSIAC